MSNEEMRKIERLDNLTETFWEVKEVLRQSETFIEEVQEEGFVLDSEFLELVEQVLYDLYKYNVNVVKRLTYILIKEGRELGEED